MKKLLLAVACFFALSTVTNAQAKQTTEKAKTAVKKEATATTEKTKKAVKHETDKVNKDGTADKRFKENKAAVKTATAPVGPLKKDGTPDKRYKANKKG